MRTRLTIMALVLAAAAAATGVIILLVITLGWPGLAIGTLGILTVLAAYRLWIQPWQHRRGATDEEVGRTMPGDDLLPDAASTTRAITIAAPADRIAPELQQLQVGDQILMVPEMGPRVSWPLTPATVFWILLSDPGAFIMERRMLKGIRSRAEAMVQDRKRRLLQNERW